MVSAAAALEGLLKFAEDIPGRPSTRAWHKSIWRLVYSTVAWQERTWNAHRERAHHSLYISRAIGSSHVAPRTHLFCVRPRDLRAPKRIPTEPLAWNGNPAS